MDKKDKKTTIDEQDLFNYVFFPDTLEKEITLLIESDSTWADIIEFYKHLKADSKNMPDDSLKRKLASKIPAYSLSNIIQLYALKETARPKQNGRLAAASTELKPGISTKTFIDGDKEFLIKVLSSDNKTKVFVFSTKEEVVKDFDLIIEPKELEYHMEDNSQPLEIKGPIEIDKIELRFS